MNGMSIKSSVKEHFTSNPLKDHLEGSSLKSHWDYFFQNESGNEISQEFNELSFRKFTRQDLDECALLFKKCFLMIPGTMNGCRGNNHENI